MLKTDCKKPLIKGKRRVRFLLDEPTQAPPTSTRSLLEKLYRFHRIQSKNLFLSNYGLPTQRDEESTQIYKQTKISYEYQSVLDCAETQPKPNSKTSNKTNPNPSVISSSLVPATLPRKAPISSIVPSKFAKSAEQIAFENRNLVFPEWHPPWKLKKVISGHLGWVRAVAVDVSNDWFITGSNDRTIKIWDLASGKLKLTLTGHTTTVRGLVVSPRHPYIFSCGEDKTVRCWDFEQNKVIRKYHGHLSGVYDLSLHPSLDVLVSSGRDSSARVWDVRTKAQIFVLSGHKSTVACVETQQHSPQVLTGSHDHTIRLWDLRTGKTLSTLTHHKKSIRDLAIHFEENVFISAAADAVKLWKCPKGDFLRNFNQPPSILNSISLNRSNVLVGGGDDGTLSFWDYKTGYCFQKHKIPPQPGSLESESGVFASAFDVTGSRLITCEADKTIKIWGEDDKATLETHPIDYKPKRQRRTLF